MGHGKASARLSHLSPEGKAKMVDVGDKDPTTREAVAAGRVRVSAAAMAAVREGQHGKGNVVETARLAGIMAAKRTSQLIPLCHPLSLDLVDVDIREADDGFDIEASVRSTGKTGVEMEALTAVSVAGLTLYDMIKAVDKAMVIDNVRLMRKDGGRSGRYVREEAE